jgi:hypothetical protein
MKPTRRLSAIAMLVAVGATVLLPGCTEERSPSPVAQREVHKVNPNPSADGVLQIRNVATTKFGDLTAKATRTDAGIDAVLKDARGNLLASLVWSQDDGVIELSSPDATPISGPDDGKQLKLAGSTFAVYYYWRQVQQALGNPKVSSDVVAMPAAPGCDYFPDALENECVSACCDAHDACWDAHDCNGWSWIGAGSLSCIWCNIKVVGCIGSCAVEAVIEIIGEIFQQ